MRRSWLLFKFYVFSDVLEKRCSNAGKQLEEDLEMSSLTLSSDVQMFSQNQGACLSALQVWVLYLQR